MRFLGQLTQYLSKFTRADYQSSEHDVKVVETVLGAVINPSLILLIQKLNSLEEQRSKPRSRQQTMKLQPTDIKRPRAKASNVTNQSFASNIRASALRAPGKRLRDQLFDEHDGSDQLKRLRPDASNVSTVSNVSNAPRVWGGAGDEPEPCVSFQGHELPKTLEYIGERVRNLIREGQAANPSNPPSSTDRVKALVKLAIAGVGVVGGGILLFEMLQYNSALGELSASVVTGAKEIGCSIGPSSTTTGLIAGVDRCLQYRPGFPAHSAVKTALDMQWSANTAPLQSNMAKLKRAVSDLEKGANFIATACSVLFGVITKRAINSAFKTQNSPATVIFNTMVNTASDDGASDSDEPPEGTTMSALRLLQTAIGAVNAKDDATTNTEICRVIRIAVDTIRALETAGTLSDDMGQFAVYLQAIVGFPGGDDAFVPLEEDRENSRQVLTVLGLTGTEAETFANDLRICLRYLSQSQDGGARATRRRLGGRSRRRSTVTTMARGRKRRARANGAKKSRRKTQGPKKGRTRRRS